MTFRASGLTRRTVSDTGKKKMVFLSPLNSKRFIALLLKSTDGKSVQFVDRESMAIES